MSLEFLEANLKKGDAYPERKDKKLIQVIGHQFCPYDERVLLVLEAKGIKYEKVNISLQEKPEFLTEKNPLSKIPVIVFDSDDKVLSESLIIIDYIEEVYAGKGRPLFPSDSYKKAQHKLFVEYFGQWTTKYFGALFSNDDEKAKWDKVFEILKTVEENLSSKLKGKFLSGDAHPGWIDYVIWPFIERFIVPITIFTNHNLDQFLAKELPTINKYRNQLLKDPAVAKVAQSVELHKAILELRLKQFTNSK